MSNKIAIDVTNLFDWNSKNFSGIQRVIYFYAKFAKDTEDIDARFFRVLEDGDQILEVEGPENLDAIGNYEFRENESVFLLTPPHIYSFFLDKLYALKIERNLKVQTIIYDLTPIKMPQHHDHGIGGAFSWALSRCRYVVDNFLCISKNTQKDLLEFYQNVSSDIQTSVFRLGEEFGDRQPVEYKKNGIKKPFAMFVSTIEPRKNHLFLIESWNRLGQSMTGLPHLYLIGKDGWLNDEVMEQIKKNTSSGISHLTDVSDDELAWFYENCEFTIYPSLYEGWGLPISESLHYGKIPLSSNTSSMPEIFPEGCLFYDPNSYEEFSLQVERLCRDNRLKKEIELRIKQDFKATTWEQSSREVYNQIFSLEKSSSEIVFLVRKCRTFGNKVMLDFYWSNSSDDNFVCTFDNYLIGDFEGRSEVQMSMFSFVAEGKTTGNQTVTLFTNDPLAFDDYFLFCSKGLRDSGVKRRFNSLEIGNNQIRTYLSVDRCLDGKRVYDQYIICSIDEKTSISPKVSVVVPVYNVDSVWLTKCIESVISQSYTNWELVLCDDCSTNTDTLETLKKYENLIPKIKTVYSKNNLGISGATSNAIEVSTGEFIALLDNDDEYHRDALMAVVEKLKTSPDADFFYTNEDKFEITGERCEEYFKPDFSQVHLMSVMYLLHFMCFKRSLFKSVGGFRAEFDGAQDYDLALRLTENANKIIHIPEILYHWRKIPGSSAAVIDAKGYAMQAAKKAVEDFSSHKYPNSKVEDGQFLGSFRVRPDISSHPSVTLVIPTNNLFVNLPEKGEFHLLRNFIESIVEKTNYPNYEILIIDNDNTPDEAKEYFSKIENIRLISYISDDPEFNFAKKVNYAFNNLESEYVLLLNDDMELITGDWIQALVECLQFEGIGIVGSRLRYSDDTIQHAGVVLAGEIGAAHVFYGYPTDSINYSGYSHLMREYLAVTGAAMMTKKSIFEELGGFDEAFKIYFNDIDFCLRAREKGYRTVFSPYSELYHYEGKSNVTSYPDPQSIKLFKDRWGKWISNDPYFDKKLESEKYSHFMMGR